MKKDGYESVGVSPDIEKGGVQDLASQNSAECGWGEAIAGVGAPAGGAILGGILAGLGVSWAVAGTIMGLGGVVGLFAAKEPLKRLCGCTSERAGRANVNANTSTDLYSSLQSNVR